MPIEETETASGGDERLRRIEAVTDASLSQLGADDFEAELLDRVREVLGVDTVAVLLVDLHAQQLVATAAIGIEEEVRRGVRVPIGQGFAGRIAAERRPIVIDHVDHTTVLNPILQDEGIQSMLGVPMIAGGEVIGVMHVGSKARREFTTDDVRVLQLAAERVSLSAQSRQARIDRGATLALQRSLLPTLLPKVPGLDLAARYIPGYGQGVGGDWYDVFTLPSGWVGLAIGDVAGHGLHAAVVMGRLRSALRAYALEYADPAEVLSHLNRKVRHFEPGMMATALYAMIEPSLENVHVSMAGHPPPVMVEPGKPGVLAPIPPDLPLGTSVSRPRRITTVPLVPGSNIVFYTDGLIERRTQSIDVGLDDLCCTVHTGPAEVVCSTIMNRLPVISPPTDDVALLVLHRLSS